MSHEDAQAQGGAEALRQELEQIRTRMSVIKQETSADVDRTWGSVWKSPEVFDLKVQTRLSCNEEYRSLRDRVREAEAALAAQSDTASEADSAR